MTSQEKGGSEVSMDELLSNSSGGMEARLLSKDSSSAPDALIRQVSPAAFAYLGDAVYELHIRLHHLLPPKRIQLYHDQVVADVRAEAQANHLRSLQPHLTDDEREVLKRGRNASPRGPKRLDPEVYQQATSLETLLGYLYVTDSERLAKILQHISGGRSTGDE